MAHQPISLDPADRILQEHVPVVMVPIRSELPAMTEYGHRYLAAQDGLWLDVSAPVGTFRIQIAKSERPLPYGAVAAYAKPVFGRVSQYAPLLRQFLANARHALPNEAAAWFTYDKFNEAMAFRMLTPNTASPGSITFDRPALGIDDCLAIDIHSHGNMAAFFSATDDADDAGDIKVSIVIGNVGEEKPTIAARLCVLGYFTDLPITAEVLV